MRSGGRKRLASISVAFATLVLIPVITVAGFWLVPGSDVWEHLCETVLKDYIVNSFLLMAGVGTLTAAIGTGTAWLVSSYDFPGRKILRVLLVLPLTFPGYIISYTYAGALDYAGPVQSMIRRLGGFATKRDYYFPEIMSLPGVVLVLSLALYPYVYLIARQSFEMSAQTYAEVSKTLGYPRWRHFLTVSLPLARPAIVAGVSLALMEALSNFGAVQYYGVGTFTTGIYRAWFSLEDLGSAARLSSLLLLFVMTVFFVELWQRRHLRTASTSNDSLPPVRTQLRAWRGFLIAGLCLLPVLLGFIGPLLQLLIWASKNLSTVHSKDFLLTMSRSIVLASVVATIVVAGALLLSFVPRLSRSKIVPIFNRIAVMGYAIPGSVISVGVLIPLAWVDNQVDGFARANFGIVTGLLLSGTVVAVGYGYLIRFMAVGFNTVSSGYARIADELDDSSVLLGSGPVRTLTKVHVPLLRKSLLAAGILVFIEIIKELPATLILRPFNFDTLATRSYELASEEMLPKASVFALAIVGTGFVLVLFMNHVAKHGGKNAEA